MSDMNIFWWVIPLEDGRPCPRRSQVMRLHTQTIVDNHANETTPQVRPEGQELP